MPFIATNDVGTTRRRKLTPRQRLKVWETTGGVCVLCGRTIDAVRERWVVEHLRALELGGQDDFGNMGPAHDTCARDKTRDDHRRAAHAKRQKIQHLGAEAPKRQLPCGRNSPWKRTISGWIVAREVPRRAQEDRSG
ncbi:HNH endonuclease [Microvirga sp. TS319]|uniref:HNH endonuclease n=1 Tax=Microvirga sp. TS319 TaxID=3241165 RepID=UPI00351A4A6F